jgi:hypothetical protein
MHHCHPADETVTVELRAAGWFGHARVLIGQATRRFVLRSGHLRPIIGHRDRGPVNGPAASPTMMIDGAGSGLDPRPPVRLSVDHIEARYSTKKRRGTGSTEQRKPGAELPGPTAFSPGMFGNGSAPSPVSSAVRPPSSLASYRSGERVLMRPSRSAGLILRAV